MKILNYISSFSSVEAYDASTLNCYAFRRGTDTKENITLLLGNMVSGYPFEINILGKELSFNQHVIAA